MSASDPTYRQTTKYRQISMAEAVVKQAWDDAINADPYQVSETDVLEAWAFLTNDSGIWKRSRILWCDVVGRCPQRLRAQALLRKPDFTAGIDRVRERKEREMQSEAAYRERKRAA